MLKGTSFNPKLLDLGQRVSELQAFLDKIGDPEKGHVIKWFNTPEELGAFVKHDVVGLLTRIFRQRHTPNITVNPTATTKRYEA